MQSRDNQGVNARKLNDYHLWRMKRSSPNRSTGRRRKYWRDVTSDLWLAIIARIPIGTPMRLLVVVDIAHAERVDGEPSCLLVGEAADFHQGLTYQRREGGPRQAIGPIRYPRLSASPTAPPSTGREQEFVGFRGALPPVDVCLQESRCHPVAQGNP